MFDQSFAARKEYGTKKFLKESYLHTEFGVCCLWRNSISIKPTNTAENIDSVKEMAFSQENVRKILWKQQLCSVNFSVTDATSCA